MTTKSDHDTKATKVPSGGRALFAAVPFVWSTVLGAQATPIRALTKPDATYSAGFTNIDVAREMKDGRVLLLDRSEHTVHIVDLAAGRAHMVGRKGRGPGEYSYPVALVTMRGDSIGIVDETNRRVLVVRADGTVGGVIALQVPDWKGEAFETNLRGTDAQGRWYFQGTQASQRGNLVVKADSIPIMRWTLGATRKDTIAWYRNQGVTASGGPRAGGRFLISVRSSGFEGRDHWAVSADARIAVARPENYQIAWTDSAGRHTLSPPISFTAQRYTEEHKQEWRRRAGGPEIVDAVGDGRVTRSMRPARPVQDPKWPEVLPPFIGASGPPLRFAPDGNLWIQRTGPAAMLPTFDVIDRQGRVIYQVTLPKSTRLVGFGTRGAIFVARIDDTDLEYLEKYNYERR